MSHPLVRRQLGAISLVLLAACWGTAGEFTSGRPDGSDGVGGGSSSSGGGTATGGGSAGRGGGTASGGGSGAIGGGSGGGGGHVGGGTASGGGSAGLGGGSAGGGGTGGSGGGAATLDKFSFFVTSWDALKALAKAHNGSEAGFGGDLTYGETGPGAGLRGADKLCSVIAEQSMPGASAKDWHAFLSVADDGTGKQLDAKDRLGNGPWYDRLGRLVATNKANLLTERPTGANALIVDDLPNEDGAPNHAPNGQIVDNHDMLTGTGSDGKLYVRRDNRSPTCLDWTSKLGNVTTEGQPRVGHSWPALSGRNWMSALDEGGCAAGVNLVEMGGPRGTSVGSGGGYGGFYCFADVP